VDDLLELVDRIGAAEREVLASKWKDRGDVETMVRSVRRKIEQRRDVERRTGSATAPTGRWRRLREAMLTDDGDNAAAVPGNEPGPTSMAEAARTEADAKAAVPSRGSPSRRRTSRSSRPG
jgi:hypothetical protein